MIAAEKFRPIYQQMLEYPHTPVRSKRDLQLNEVIVVPATRTIRGIDTEVVLTSEDGMSVACALNFDMSHWP